MSRSALKYSRPVKPATAVCGLFMAASAARTFSRSAALLSARFRMSARPKASTSTRGVMRAGCDPTRRCSRQRRIGGGKGLRGGAGAVENERRGRVEIIGGKNGVFLFLPPLRKIFQKTFIAGTAPPQDSRPYAAPTHPPPD